MSSCYNFVLSNKIITKRQVIIISTKRTVISLVKNWSWPEASPSDPYVYSLLIFKNSLPFSGRRVENKLRIYSHWNALETLSMYDAGRIIDKHLECVPGIISCVAPCEQSLATLVIYHINVEYCYFVVGVQEIFFVCSQQFFN